MYKYLTKKLNATTTVRFVLASIAFLTLTGALSDSKSYFEEGGETLDLNAGFKKQGLLSVNTFCVFHFS